MLTFFQDFFNDPTTKTLFAAILLDLVLAVAAALKLGKFDMRKLADFYRSKVLPYVLGFCLVFAFGYLGLSQWLGSLIWGQVTSIFGAGLIMVSLLGDIGDHLKELQRDPLADPQDASNIVATEHLKKALGALNGDV